MCKPEPTAEERETLKYYYYFEKYSNYATRIGVLPIFYVLYKKKFFDKKSPFFIREIAACLIGISFIGGGDLLASEYMWKNCYPIVKRYNNVMDSYFLTTKEKKKLRNEAVAISKDQKLYDD